MGHVEDWGVSRGSWREVMRDPSSTLPKRDAKLVICRVGATKNVASIVRNRAEALQAYLIRSGYAGKIVPRIELVRLATVTFDIPPFPARYVVEYGIGMGFWEPTDSKLHARTGLRIQPRAQSCESAVGTLPDIGSHDIIQAD